MTLANRPFVAYIPAENVAKIPEPSLLVSIKGKYNDRPNIDREKHHVFNLDFDVGEWAIDAGYNLQPAQVEELLAFLETHKDSGRNLYIHCTEGRIRSYTVAEMVQREGFYRGVSRSECPLLGPGGAGDANTRDVYLDYIIAQEEAEEAAGEAGQ